jgi:hypothetical protein
VFKREHLHFTFLVEKMWNSLIEGSSTVNCNIFEKMLNSLTEGSSTIDCNFLTQVYNADDY